MSLTTDIQAHADAIAVAVATSIGAQITATPKAFAADRAGVKLEDAIVEAVKVASAARDYSDIGIPY